MARYGQLTLQASGGVDDFVPSIIVPEVQDSAARQEVFRPLCKQMDVTGPGDTFTVPQTPALAWSQLGSQDYIDAEPESEVAVDTTARSFVPIFYALDVVVALDAMKLTAPGISTQDQIIKEVGIGLALHHDSLAAALYTEAPATTPTHEIGTDGVALSYSSTTAATQLLYIQNAPRPFSWVIHPIQWGELMVDNTFINAATAGQPGLTIEQGDNGFITKVFDTRIYISDQIDEVSGLHSMWFSTARALAYAFRRLSSPISGADAEVMLDIDWNSARRAFEINSTYSAVFGGLVKTSTTNNWMVDLIS